MYQKSKKDELVEKAILVLQEVRWLDDINRREALEQIQEDIQEQLDEMDEPQD